MDVKVCKNCRRLFNYMYGPELCPECYRLLSENKVEPNSSTDAPKISPEVNENELKFIKIRDYIMLNPMATVSQIAEANGIPPSKLFEWIREERLEFSDDSPHAWFKCERCGTRIRSGRLCNKCKLK